MRDGSFHLVVGCKMAISIKLWHGKWQTATGSIHLVVGWVMAVPFSSGMGDGSFYSVVG